MISIEELGAILKCLVISNQSVTTIERLQREFRETEGYPIPLYKYASVQDLLMNGLSKSVTVYGKGQHAIVSAVVTSKTQHVHNLVSGQKRSRPRKRLSKKNHRSFPSYQSGSGNSITRNFVQSYSPSYRASKVSTPNQYPKYNRENKPFCSNNTGYSNTNGYHQTTRLNQSPDNWRETTLHTKSNDLKFVPLERRAINYNVDVKKWSSNEGRNTDISSRKSNNYIASNDSGHESPLKAKNYSFTHSPTSSTDASSKENVNKPSVPQHEQKVSVSAGSEYEEYDFDCDEAVPEFACNDHIMLLEHLREYQKELLNDSSKSCKVAEVNCIYEFEKSLNISSSSHDYIEDPLDFTLYDNSEQQADNVIDKLDDANKQENVPEPPSKSCDDHDLDCLSNVCLNRSASNALNSSLPSLIFSIKEQFIEEDSEEAVPDFAITNRVFSCDFPEHTVPFGQKIEPFEMPDEVQVDSIISIYISEVHNPFRFWFHYAAEDLDELMHNIELFYAQDAVAHCYKMLPEQIQRGQICVALYNGAWHRAEILFGIIGDKVKVYYLDYGTVGDVAIDELLYLNVEFAEQAAYACRGCLAEISPIRLHWSTEASTALLTMVSNRKLHAKVCEIDKENRVFYLQMVDNHTENVIHINRELIKLKHATKCYEWMRCKLTGNPRLRHKREDYPTFDMLEGGDYPTFIEIYAMKASGINYEDMTDKMIYHPSIVNINDNLKKYGFLLLSNNPFKEDIEKQLSQEIVEEQF